MTGLVLTSQKHNPLLLILIACGDILPNKIFLIKSKSKVALYSTFTRDHYTVLHITPVKREIGINFSPYI